MNRDCEFCGGPAQWQFTEVVGGTKHTVYVCPKCAQQNGLVSQAPVDTPPAGPSATITSIKIDVGAQIDPGAVPTAPRRCPGCGTSLVEIRKVGRVGCPACYVAFREHLSPLLQRVHGCTSHDVEGGETASLQDLERRLRAAVLDEDFEGAARIRDQIEVRRTRARRGGEA